MRGGELPRSSSCGVLNATLLVQVNDGYVDFFCNWLWHARAAGEKVSVGFKMEEVETMVSYRSQRDTLLHNVLGGWNARLKCFRKLRYALVLLREVENCGGAPVKHKNWTIVRARVTGCGVQS